MKPFEEYDLGATLSNQYAEIKKKIEKLSNEEIMANDIDVLTENLYQTFFVEPVVIEEEAFSKRKMKQGKIRRYVDEFFRSPYDPEYVDVDGVKAYFYYPYTGEKKLFSCRASVFSLGGYPEIELKDGCVEIVIEKTLAETKQNNSSAQIISQAERAIKEIKSGIEYANTNVNAFNAGLRNHIRKELEQKKANVQSFFDIAKALEVPIEKKDYSKKHVAVERRIVPIAHNYKKEDYYCISEEDYRDILETIKHIGSTYERTPASYKGMHEEDLRNTLLAGLNATYKGGVTGETFRKNGKTDICIEQSNRAAFVAECKMWTGPKAMREAIEQLDSYLTWRDCKTALIYFVRKKGFLQIIEKAKSELNSIENMKEVKELDKNEFSCVYMSNENPGQLVRIRVMLFNMAYE